MCYVQIVCESVGVQINYSDFLQILSTLAMLLISGIAVWQTKVAHNQNRELAKQNVQLSESTMKFNAFSYLIISSVTLPGFTLTKLDTTKKRENYGHDNIESYANLVLFTAPYASYKYEFAMCFKAECSREFFINKIKIHYISMDIDTSAPEGSEGSVHIAWGEYNNKCTTCEITADHDITDSGWQHYFDVTYKIYDYSDNLFPLDGSCDLGVFIDFSYVNIIGIRTRCSQFFRLENVQIRNREDFSQTFNFDAKKGGYGIIDIDLEPKS